MDEFDFDDIDEQKPKKQNDKRPNKQATKKNSWKNQDDDFYDLEIQDNPKPKQSKLNNLSDDYLDFETDKSPVKKQKNQQKKEKEKQDESSMFPKISQHKSPRNSQQKPIRSKMDLSLQELPEKKSVVKQEQKKNKKKFEQQEEEDLPMQQQQVNDFAVHKMQNEIKNNVKPKSQKELQQSFERLKDKETNQPPNKKGGKPKLQQKIAPSQTENSTPLKQNNTKIIQKPSKKQEVQKSIQYDEYEDEQYQQEIFDDQQDENQKNQKMSKKNNQNPNVKPSKIKLQEKHIKSNTKSQQVIVKNDSKNIQKINENLNKKGQNTKQQKITNQKNKQKPQISEEKINKYKQLVQKSFPNDQDQQKIQKLKPDAVNRINEKMREMIKGFSKELTDMIDKNLTLLRRAQNQIKEQIEGEIDPVQAEIKLLEQMKKNNQKMLQNTEKQLQAVTRTNQKVSSSAQSNLQMSEQIQAYKNQISIISRQNTNLKNEIEKQGRKVTKMEENNKIGVGQDIKESKFKSALQITQRLANFKSEFDKNRKKLTQLEQKLSNLEDKMTQITKKRNKIYEKAENQGISFHTKEQKKRYDDLKKKRYQHQVFESKYKASIKSKQALIQHEMTDFQVLIAQYEKRYQLINQQVEKSKKNILTQIAKAKKNPKIHSNTKQILAQLEMFMTEENSGRSQEQQNALSLLSNNIYKKQYQSKGNSKTLQDQKTDRKIEYKNYLLEVARKNQQARKKSTTERKVSQNNPFRKAATPNQSHQGSATVEKMSKTKQANKNLQTQKQQQRIWKSSNTEVLLRNPLKRNVQNKPRYEETKQQQNPLQNKEIMSLINKNKQKILLKSEQRTIKASQQQPSSKTMVLNKKPFTLRASVKEQVQQIQQLAGISKQMERIQKEIESHRGSLKRETELLRSSNKNIDVQLKENENVPVKLKDYKEKKPQQTINLQDPTEIKPVSNKTPFRNLRLKKEKDKISDPLLKQAQSNNNLPSQQIAEQKFENKLHNLQKQQTKQQTPVVEDAPIFKPKRFNLRKKNENQSQSYIPSSRNIQNQTPLGKEQKPLILNKQNPIIVNAQTSKHNDIKKYPISKIQQNSKKQQAFDPFKKFMVNQKKQQQSSCLISQPVKQPLLKLNQNKQTDSNTNKPRMISLKKAGNDQSNQQTKKLILLGDSNKADNMLGQKVINPYAQIAGNQKQFQGPKIQREGRPKKINQALNLSKPANNKNIFADVEDATLNSKIESIGDPQPPKKEPEPYIPKSISADKQFNVNDLLGIKKKNYEVDKQLLIDLPGDNKLGLKAKGKGKANDFFGDMDI